MARRVVVDDDRAVGSYSEQTVERPPVASVVARVLTAVYAFVIGMIALDALFRALDANRSNGFVSGVRSIARPLEAPFRGMFDNQQWFATALVAAVVYTVVYLIAMAILRRDRTY
ncbi:MAG TPA: hypothetical protein VGX28_07905 [Frankiaceae bacterium]|jgi:hypothetical protein|nr:hypothetical protein [Frankiaceae bacterium]